MTDRAADAAGRIDNPPTAERLVTLAAAARVLGVSERTIRRRIENHDLPGVKAGGRLMVPASAVPGVTELDTLSLARAGQRRTTPDSTDAALVALVERQAAEIARLSAELAVAHERLRMLAAETAPNAAQTRHDARHAAQPSDATNESRSRWWAWLRRIFGSS